MKNYFIPETLLPSEIGYGLIYEDLSKISVPNEVSRSYSSNGFCLELYPLTNNKVVGDIEAVNKKNGLYLAGHCSLNIKEFLCLWTKIEVISKLENIPAVILYKLYQNKGENNFFSLFHDNFVIKTSLINDLMISVGWKIKD